MLSLEQTFLEKIAKNYRDAPLDAASFHRPYKACTGDCEAICCSGGSGFYLPEEPETIRKLAVEHREFFLKNGIPIDDGVIEELRDEETGEVELNTKVKPMNYPVGKKPDHFDHTACTFRRASDGFCTLQLLSLEQGKPSWWYKPVACWLFPLELEHDGKPFIHVAHASTDEYVDDEYPGFVGYTKCGAECPTGGKPAYQVLEHELRALSKMIDRDLLSEILAYKETAA